jgi:hypothetical protein
MKPSGKKHEINEIKWGSNLHNSHIYVKLQSHLTSTTQATNNIANYDKQQSIDKKIYLLPYRCHFSSLDI